MTALLAAEWLRLRGRRDLWALAVVGPVLMAITFVTSVTSASSGLDTYRQVPITPAQRADLLSGYSFPGSLVAMLSMSFVLAVTTMSVAMVVLGEDFSFGTVGQALRWARSRWRYLLAKQLCVAIVATGSVAAVLGCALVVPVGLVAAGTPLGNLSIDPLTITSICGAAAMTTTTFAFVAICAVLLARSIVPAAIGVFLCFVAESTLLGLPIWSGPLGWVRELDLTRASTALMAATEATVEQARGVAPEPALGTAPPGWVSFCIVLMWAIGLGLLAHWRFRTMDITE